MKRPTQDVRTADPAVASILEQVKNYRPNPFLSGGLTPSTPFRVSPFRSSPFSGGGKGRPPISPFRSAAGSPFGNRESRNPFQPRRQVRRTWSALPTSRRPRTGAGPGTRWVIPVREICDIYEWEIIQMYVGDGENFDSLALVNANQEGCPGAPCDYEKWGSPVYDDEDGQHCHGLVAVRYEAEEDIVGSVVDFDCWLEAAEIPIDQVHALWEAFVPEFRDVREFAQESVWDILTRWGGAVALPVMRRVGYSLRGGATSGHELMEWFDQHWSTDAQLRSCWGDWIAMTGLDYLDPAIAGGLGELFRKVGDYSIFVFDEDEMEFMYWNFPDDSDRVMPIQGWHRAIESDYYSCFDEGQDTTQPWVISWRELRMEQMTPAEVEEALRPPTPRWSS